MPSQCSMARTVVAFSVAPVSPCSTGFMAAACTPSASAVRLARLVPGRDPGICGVIGVVGGVHLETHDLPAVEVEDQVQIEPASLQLCRQERHIPAPYLTGASGDVGARWARAAG